MNALETRIAELTAWRASEVRIYAQSESGAPRIVLGAHKGPILAPESTSMGVYTYSGDMAQEPEFQAAWLKLQDAVQGIRDAREAIIRRKALELAAVVHGEQLNGIRALVDQIQEGAGS